MYLCRMHRHVYINFKRLKSVCKSCQTQCMTSFADFHFDASTCLSDQTKEVCIEQTNKLNEQFGNVLMKRLSRIKKAAVLIPLCEVNGVPSILFTVRSFALRKNGGQVSFPGGTVDMTDKTLAQAAIRECEEEIGFCQDKVDVWVTLPPLPDRNFELMVYGVIGNLGKVNLEELKPNEDEVSRIFTVPVEYLCNPENIRSTTFRVNSKVASIYDYTMPVYLTKPRIWGLTASYLDIALLCLFPSFYQLFSNFRSMKRMKTVGR